MSEAITIQVTENTETITQTIVENGETITLTINEAARGPAGSGSGSGDVVGPASVTDGRPALFDGITGKLIKQHSAALGTAAQANLGTGAGQVPVTGDYVPANGANSITVSVSADNAAANGTALLAAYAAAKLLTPNGAALGAYNRASVILPPGNYKVPSVLTLDAEYVDILAQIPQMGGSRLSTDDCNPLTTQKSMTVFRPNNAVVYSDVVGVSVVTQTARNVRLIGFTIAKTGTDDSYGATSYAFSFSGTGANANDESYYERMYFWHVHSFSGSAMGYGNYNSGCGFAKHVKGMWVQCIFDDFALRCGASGSFQATMLDCQIGPFSVGGDEAGASMGPCRLERCKCIGLYYGATDGCAGFGGCVNFGVPTLNTAWFVDCEAGYGSFSVGMPCAGNYIRCKGGDGSFGGTNSDGVGHEGTFSGYAEACTGGAGSLGGSNVPGKGNLTGTLWQCKAEGSVDAWRCAGAEIRDSRLTVTTTGKHCLILLDSNTSVQNSEVLVLQGGTGIPVYAATALNVEVLDCIFNNLSNDADGLGANVTNTATNRLTAAQHAAATAAQIAAIPSVRALGTGALEAMPGNTAVVLATGATTGATSQAQAFTNGVLLQSATNQIVTGTTTNLTTTNFPASSGAVTVTMPNTTSTVARSASALTTGRVVFTTTNGVLTDSANLTWNGTTLAITGAVTVSTTLAVTGAGTFTGLLTANGGIQSGTGAGELDVVSASGALLGIRTVEATSAAMSGAAVTFANLIPAGSYVLGVTARNTTATSHTYNIGDGTDVDAWGAAIVTTLNNSTTSADFNITAPAFYKALTSVVLTPIGGNFTSGAVKVAVHYITLTGPTA